jgi:MFS family permease
MKPKMNLNYGVAILMLSYMMFGNLSNLSYSPLSIFIKSSFSISLTQLGLIASTSFIGYLSILIVVGVLVDSYGAVFSLKVSFITISIGAGIALFSTYYWEILVAYFVIGLGYGILTPATNKIVMNHYYPFYATSMGIKQAGVPLGTIISVAILPLISIHFSLRLAFLAILLASVPFIFISNRFEGGDNERRVEFSKYGRELARSFLKNKSLLTFGLIGAILSWNQQTILVYYVVFMHSMNYSALSAELMLAFILVGAILGRIFWTSAGQRIFGSDRIASVALIAIISGATVILFPLMTFSEYLSVVIAFFMGFASLGWNGVFIVAISEIAPRDKIGLYSGVGLIYVSIGAIIGTPLMGFVKDYTGSFQIIWIVLGFSLFLMSVVLVFVAYHGKHGQRDS